VTARVAAWVPALTDRLNRGMDLLPRPLDPVRSIKIKIGLLLVASGLAGLVVFIQGIGWIPWYTSATAVGVALLTSQVLAHGMTSPLREMTAAARAMARGDYSRRVRATSRDEVGELASAFNTMAGELAAADRQRRELIANVSHELRTPVTALRGLLENIVDGVAEPEPDTLATALAQTERLGRLVTELLDLSRLDAGAVPLNLVDLDLPAFLREAVREAEMTAAGAGRNVRFAVSTPEVPLRVRADPGRLHQVLANLLDNAARHSPAGGLVLVSARALPDGVVVEVTDEGGGIPAGQRASVFERFVGGAGTAGQDGGTGLGLAIARWVVQLHGGTIAVTEPERPTEAGPGCRIRVTLPHPSPPA
jgi:signal transduction histidine kinase